MVVRLRIRTGNKTLSGRNNFWRGCLNTANIYHYTISFAVLAI